MVAVVTLPPGTTVDTPAVRPQLHAAFARVAAAVPQSRSLSHLSDGRSGGS
jgi:hypothetical protein